MLSGRPAARDSFAPQLTRLQHVRLVHRAQLVVTSTSGAESRVRDAFDFRFRIAHRVEADALACLVGLEAARLTEIGIAVQLANDHDVESIDDFRPQGRSADQFREHIGRTEVRVQRERFAQLQETRSGTTLAGYPCFVRDAYRTEQDGVGLARHVERGLRKGHAVRPDAGLADMRLLGLCMGRHDLQHLERLRHYFRTDAITGHDCNLHLNSSRSFWKARASPCIGTIALECIDAVSMRKRVIDLVHAAQQAFLREGLHIERMRSAIG